MSNVISLSDVYDHLERKTQAINAQSRDNVLKLIDWVGKNNEKQGDFLITYLREEENVAFTTDSYRHATRKPFILISTWTQMIFPQTFAAC